MDSLNKHWGEILHKARTDKVLSQRELAKKAGISQSYLMHLEHGQRSPSDEVRIALAKALNKSVGKLFPYPDPTNPKTLKKLDEQ